MSVAIFAARHIEHWILRQARQVARNHDRPGGKRRAGEELSACQFTERLIFLRESVYRQHQSRGAELGYFGEQSEQQRNWGIALAKERGVYKGRKPSLTPDKVKVIRRRLIVSLEP